MKNKNINHYNFLTQPRDAHTSRGYFLFKVPIAKNHTFDPKPNDAMKKKPSAPSRKNKPKQQHQDYNNVIQENLNESMELLLRVVFRLDELRTAKLSTRKIHRTVARDPDLLLALVDENGVHQETSHAEIHLKDEAEISYRMAEYGIMEYRQFKKPVRLFVLYIGTGKAKNIQAELDAGDVQIKIRLVNIQDISYRAFLQSNRPEEAVLGILGGFGDTLPAEAISEIIRHIRKLTPEQERLTKYSKQLEILSNLRKLQPEILKQIEAMPITYDLSTDARYQQGMQQGMQQGENKGIEKGQELKARITVERMLLAGQHTEEEIAFFADVSLGFVKKIKANIERKNTAKPKPDKNGKH